MDEQVRKVLLRAAEILEPEGAWGQRAYALDATGERTLWGWDNAVCWCAVGAVSRAGLDTGLDIAGPLRALSDSLGENIYYFNDAPERTKAEVIAALRKAAQ